MITSENNRISMLLTGACNQFQDCEYVAKFMLPAELFTLLMQWLDENAAVKNITWSGASLHVTLHCDSMQCMDGLAHIDLASDQEDGYMEPAMRKFVPLANYWLQEQLPSDEMLEDFSGK